MPDDDNQTAEWTEGVCGDGVVILRDGSPVPISEVLIILNEHERHLAVLKAILHGASSNPAERKEIEKRALRRTRQEVIERFLASDDARWG